MGSKRGGDGGRLLVLGSMEEFVPLVRRARERGIATVVCDGNADGPAKALADARHDVDVRDAAAIARICREERVDGIITAYSDLLAECAAAAAGRAGLGFYLPPERLALLRDKTLMKRMFDELGVPRPRSALVSRGSVGRDLAGLRFPVVTKPLSSWGSRGVFLLEGPEQVEGRFDEVAAFGGGDSIIVEEYNDGFELNLMSWVVDGEPVVLEAADREKSREVDGVPPHVSRIVYPSVLTDFVLDEAAGILARVARHVGLECGPLCMQLFWSPERGVEVCECAGRVFGYEHELLELATGGALTVEDLLLDTVYDPPAAARRLGGHDPHLPRVAAGLYFHGHEGRVARIEGLPEPGEGTGVADVTRYYAPGDEVSRSSGAKPYVARVYLEAASRDAVDALTDEVFASASVVGEAGEELLYHSERASYARAFHRGRP